MEIRSFQRATEPHFGSLASALEPVLRQFFMRYDKGTLFINADFTGTTNQAVQAIIDAAPVASPALDAKAQADSLTLIERAAYLTLLDGINAERARHTVAAITPAQFVAQVKAKVDALAS